MESTLIALADDSKEVKGSVTLLLLLDLSVDFDNIDHGILLGCLCGSFLYTLVPKNSIGGLQVYIFAF